MAFSFGFYSRDLSRPVAESPQPEPGRFGNYTRTARLAGGDGVARFSVYGAPEQLEQWLFELPAMRFVEWGHNRPVFDGRVLTARLATGQGDVLSLTLAGMANSVAVEYQPDKATPKAVTAWSTDGDSVARYGLRQRLIAPRRYLSAAEAAGLRDQMLALLARPQVRTEGLGRHSAGRRPLLEIEATGWYEQLVATLATLPTGAVNLGSHIAEIAGGGGLATGGIAATAIVVEREAQNVVRWERLRQYFDSHQGQDEGFFRMGCFGGAEFVFEAVPVGASYYRRAGVIGDGDGNRVPAQLVQPGRWLLSSDMLASQHARFVAAGGSDPRMVLIDEVVYTQSDDSVVVRAANTAERLAALRLRLA